MTSLEENLVGRELINALDKSPEAAQGYQKTSFDYRPRFASADLTSKDLKLRKYSRDSGFGESLISEIPENLDDFFNFLPEPTPLLPDFSIPAIPTEQNEQNSCPWEELEQKCDEKMKKYFRPNPMIISMRMEARIQLEYKKLGLPDDGRPGSRLLERYVNQYGDNAHDALRDIKKLLEQISENSPEAEENGEINFSKINFSACQTSFKINKLRQHRELFIENIQAIVPNFPKSFCNDAFVFSLNDGYFGLTELKIKISNEIEAIKTIIHHVESLIPNPSSALIASRDRLISDLSSIDKTTTHSDALYKSFTSFVQLIIEQVDSDIYALPLPAPSAYSCQFY
ncbi:unnamed protein product [Oikopleura dioica]|uniref:Uncharacterized protein n=1 Tax=Oikopleura dioica TaxID=34765 RepID=E4XRX6_OIKDI|nr:unnamed protein product [Oikopleura dioica]